MELAIKLLKECEPFLSGNFDVGMTNAVYITPAEQLRRQADRMEYEADLKRRVRDFIEITEK